jgi:hypothetical protein
VSRVATAGTEIPPGGARAAACGGRGGHERAVPFCARRAGWGRLSGANRAGVSARAALPKSFLRAGPPCGAASFVEGGRECRSLTLDGGRGPNFEAIQIQVAEGLESELEGVIMGDRSEIKRGSEGGGCQREAAPGCLENPEVNCPLS